MYIEGESISGLCMSGVGKRRACPRRSNADASDSGGRKGLGLSPNLISRTGPYGPYRHTKPPSSGIVTEGSVRKKCRLGILAVLLGLAKLPGSTRCMPLLLFQLVNASLDK
jgi:hypothetical protein